MKNKLTIIDNFPQTDYSYQLIETFLPYVVLREYYDDTEMYDIMVKNHYTGHMDEKELFLVDQYYNNMAKTIIRMLQWKGLDRRIQTYVNDYVPIDCTITYQGTMYLEFTLR